MNKQELLNALGTKYYKVLTPQLQRTIDNLGWYVVSVYKKTTDRMQQLNLTFYVESEGEGGEAAYWDTSEPSPTVSTTLFKKINGYITAKILDGTIKEGIIERLNEDNKNAIVRVIIDEAGTLKEYRLLIDETSPDVYQYTKITSS